MFSSHLSLNLCTFIVLFTPILTYLIRNFFPQNMDKFNSVAGGMGLVSVIVAMIPGIVEKIPEILKEDRWTYLTSYPRVSYVLFLCMLGGFVVMYTLEKLAYQKKKEGKDPSTVIYFSHVFCLCLVLFAAVSALPAIGKASLLSLYLFTLVLCFEILLEENGLIRYYKERFHNGTRTLIVGSGILGYFFGTHFVEHMPHLVYSGIEGVIIGVLLLAIVKTEFDLLEQRSHFPTFLMSAFFKATVLFLIFFIL